ncbi:MAG: DUF4476 domain-containing protein [Bacteroidetes bacterium]|nr:DUF4476 domain-containing protein [Bacteroidota bacterium]
MNKLSPNIIKITHFYFTCNNLKVIMRLISFCKNKFAFLKLFSFRII